MTADTGFPCQRQGLVGPVMTVALLRGIDIIHPKTQKTRINRLTSLKARTNPHNAARKNRKNRQKPRQIPSKRPQNCVDVIKNADKSAKFPRFRSSARNRLTPASFSQIEKPFFAIVFSSKCAFLFSIISKNLFFLKTETFRYFFRYFFNYIFRYFFRSQRKIFDGKNLRFEGKNGRPISVLSNFSAENLRRSKAISGQGQIHAFKFPLL
ncbi:MAG: hypothetical protein PHI85_09045 [Victivallaceae bacterium]|nr:hypothetical protein [Victivallaceae bacterium]